MDDFERHYEEVYGAGSGYSIAGMEAISFRVDGIGKTPKPSLKSYEEKGTDPSPAAKGTRKVCFASGDVHFIETKLYDYAKLEAGNRVNGPAIIEAPDTTIVIPPGCTSRVDIYRNVEIGLR
jgi:N-methylhydantoinase A